MSGLFREHPAGIFLLPAALSRLGIPGEQAAYVVGIAAGLLSVLFAGMLAARLAGRSAGRAVLILIQLMPVAFIFRIRANHEYPMLVCLLAALLSLDGIRRSPWWTFGVGAALSLALVTKGVFVVLIVAGALLWIAIDPMDGRARARQAGALVAGLAMMALVAVAYDLVYVAVTGEPFWQSYWARQLGPLRIATPLEGAASLVTNAIFYLSRLVWLPAPWSLALLTLAWRHRHGLARWTAIDRAPVRRGLLFALLFAAASVVVLSPSNRYAERYAFSATYVIAAAGIVTAWHRWPRLRAVVQQLDRRIPALPVVAWTASMLLRLGLGPLLPRL
jgi:4-amino-4-deoxy-L-arabinose transferase-like glycosyltransferase